MGVVAGGLGDDAPGARIDLGELVGVLQRHEERAAGPRELDVTRGARDPDAPAHHARARVDERDALGPLGRDGGQARRRVDRDALRAAPDAHDAARGLGLRRR